MNETDVNKTNINTDASLTDDSPARTPFELVVWFLVPGILQGGVFYLLGNEFSELEHAIRIALFWFVVTAPLAHFLITTHRHRGSALTMAVAVAVVCSLLVYWYGAPLEDGSKDRIEDFFFVMSLFCTIVIGAATLPFFRTWASGKRFNDYPSLFKFSWNQVVSVLVGLAFVLAVNAILGLSTMLFKLIGINIGPFIWRGDVTAVVFGGSFALGVGICRTRDGMVNGVRYLLISLLRALLPVFVFIIGAFIVVAALNGLDEFTVRLSVTAVMLASIALALTLCSAAVGDSKKIESRWLSILCRAMAILMVALCSLAVWAMWQRVEQHGLTGSRVLAVVLLAVSAVYALGYLLASLSRNVSGVIQQTNVFMILICGVVAVVLQTPWLSPQTIAAKNQFARFESGKVSAEKLDLGWLKYKAGNEGERVLEDIRQMPQSQIDPLKTRFAKLDSYETYWEYKSDKDSLEMQEKVVRMEEAVEIIHLAPVGIKKEAHQDVIEHWARGQIKRGGLQLCPLPTVVCVLVEADVFDGWANEYLLIMRRSGTEVILRWVNQQNGSYDYLANVRSYRSPDTWIDASVENIDSLMTSAKNGIVPLGTIELPAVKLGDQLFNPYDDSSDVPLNIEILD